MMKLVNIMVGCVLFLMLPVQLQALPSADQSATNSVQRFVQGFYDWYVPLALKEGPFPTIDLALKEKSFLFSGALAQALHDDSAARAKSPEWIVGLDGDPFLNAQDPCEQYEAGQATQDGNRYKVEVFRICSGKKGELPDVIAELEKKGDSWIFINFYYPGDGDLLTELKLLKKDRESHKGKGI